MQNADGGALAKDDFTAPAGSGEKRFSRINGLAAVSLLLFGGVEILTVLVGHQSSADSLQAIVIAGLSFGLGMLALKMTPEL